MKIAVLADIHANLPALQSVIADIEAWRPDEVIVAGDIVNRGPESLACLELVLRMCRERGWRLIRGNHEGYVLRYDRDHRLPDFPAAGPRRDLSRMTAWSHAQVEQHIATIAAMPEHLRLAAPAGPLVVYHASVRHDRDGIMGLSSDAELRQQIDPAAAVFCVGHTHMPFVRRVDETLLVNVGSVGLSFDGDTRAAYAQLSLGRAGWQAQIVRLPYDLAATERAYYASGMLDFVGPIGDLMLREVQTGRSLIFDFVPVYHERLMAGAISIGEAVSEFLSRIGRAA
jgi:putative phosphoesterase